MRDGWIRVGCATPEVRVGDIPFQQEQIVSILHEAKEEQVGLLVFPELSLTGSTCGDLFLQNLLLERVEAALEAIVCESKDIPALIILGMPLYDGACVYDAAVGICQGKILGIVPKTQIPPEQARFFSSGVHAGCETREMRLCGQSVMESAQMLFTCINMPGLRIGVEFGSDLLAPQPPSGALVAAGASVIVCLDASVELAGRAQQRRQAVCAQSERLACGYMYTGAGEGESTTDAVFAGHRLIAENGELLAEARWSTGLLYSELDLDKLLYVSRQRGRAAGLTGRDQKFTLPPIETPLSRHIPQNPFLPETPQEREKACADIFRIQTEALYKRCAHTNCQSLIVGVSGGLDSTLALLVCEAVVRKNPGMTLQAVTMPCFGTTERTKSNAVRLAELVGAEIRVVDIGPSVTQHLQDIGHAPDHYNVTYENAQARERTQVLMDIANDTGALVVGTGDLSELALGWATYNGDHMSMYAVNAGLPKTVIRAIVHEVATERGGELQGILEDILDTPVSPELLPASAGEISQKTEDLVGPYALHDFFLYGMLCWGYGPKKLFRLACYAFDGQFNEDTIRHWLRTFVRRFFTQQYKRSCMPDGPAALAVSLSPRGGWSMPSDASMRLWREEAEAL